MGQEELINSLYKTVENLINVVNTLQDEIETLQSAVMSTGDMINNHDEGIKLILQVLNSNGLINVEI